MDGWINGLADGSESMTACANLLHDRITLSLSLGSSVPVFH